MRPSYPLLLMSSSFILFGVVGAFGPTKSQKISADSSIRVIDGDTIAFGATRIRLFGIDAPEINQTCKFPSGKIWNCGEAAKKTLSEIIARNHVTCDERQRDKYGRLIAICTTSLGIDLSGLMVELGLAVAYTRYSLAYLGQEKAARSEKRGIWATEFTLPEEWRHRNE